jgi:hypothetical protein
MRRGTLFLVTALELGTLVPSGASAEQPHDWYIGPQEDGTILNAGFFFPGVITSVEHKVSLYGQANQLVLRGTGILTYPFTDGQLDVDLRVVLVSAGVSIGGRESWRNMSFEQGDRMDRSVRRIRWSAGDFDNAAWPHAEARVSLALPFNDYVLFNCVNSARYEDRPDPSYDWRNGIVHDRGMLYKSESMFFFKHKAFGGLGPMLTFLDFELNGERHTQIMYGFTFLSRAGITRWNDLIAIQMWFYGDTMDDFDNSDIYGADMWRGPWNIMVAYMSIIPL